MSHSRKLKFLLVFFSLIRTFAGQMEKKVKAALFDLDGVVFDTEPQYTVFWGAQCREFHPEHPGLEHEIKGQTLTQIYERCFTADGLAEKQALITRRLDEFEAQMHFDYVDGFEDFVHDLRKRGIKTAVVTSSNLPKMQSVYRQRPEFQALFDAILTSEDFERSKPDPDCYLKAAQRFGLEPTECVVFEDSFNGLKSGRAAGMTVVGLSTTNSPDDIAPFCNQVIPNYIDFKL
jgi:HAD superfamily hydrolase (TIGR01509 family)